MGRLHLSTHIAQREALPPPMTPLREAGEGARSTPSLRSVAQGRPRPHRTTTAAQFTQPVPSSARMYSMTESLQPSIFIHLP